jgi:hypothetical protein
MPGDHQRSATLRHSLFTGAVASFVEKGRDGVIELVFTFYLFFFFTFDLDLDLGGTFRQLN